MKIDNVDRLLYELSSHGGLQDYLQIWDDYGNRYDITRITPDEDVTTRIYIEKRVYSGSSGN